MTNLSDISKQIRVQVKARLEEEQSDLQGANFIYAYRIKIENLSNHAVQLLRRHWTILDSLAGKRTVEGAGVIGKQPILESGAAYAYESWCPLISEIGEMSGYYTFIDLETREQFDVEIPLFHLQPEYSLN
ncbi:Co2+/Mg2+ efflux protein ApaG [bacterium]|nr:Co2+/Mg2+ efflux protein ApaG [bacterium]